MSRPFHRFSARLLTMASPTPTPATPRQSASLLLFNSRNEVLLVQRPTHSSTFANAHVFPGGVVTASDSDLSSSSHSPTPTIATLKVTALRETFEETGLLLTTSRPPKSTDLSSCRKQVHFGTLGFDTFLDSWGGKLATEGLVPFTRWITPKTMKRRFETQMFLGFLPAVGEGEGEIPAHDGGLETVSAAWHSPASALLAEKRKQMVLPTPQLYLLSRLAEILTPPPPSSSSSSPSSFPVKSIQEQRRELVEFATGEFGDMVFEPRRLRVLEGDKIIFGFGEKADPERVFVALISKTGGEPQELELKRVEEVAKL